MRASRGKAQWAQFEQMLAWIQEQLHAHAKITLDDQLLDRSSGEMRQVDITLRFRDGPTELLILVEARDRGRRIDPEYVDAIVNKRRSLGADAAVIVSRQGFSRAALKKAEHEGIRTMTYSEAKTNDWSGWAEVREMKVVNRRYEHAVVTLYRHGTGFEERIDVHPDEVALLAVDATKMLLLLENGEVAGSLKDFADATVSLFKDEPYAGLAPNGERRRSQLLFTGECEPALFVRAAHGGMERIGHVIVEADLFLQVEAFPARFFRYKRTDAEESLAEVLVADLRIGQNIMRVELLAQGGGDSLPQGTKLALRTRLI